MRNGNEVETICDTAIRLLINSVTKQLLTEIMTNTQLSDFLISGMILNELLIDGDNRRSVKESRATQMCCNACVIYPRSTYCTLISLHFSFSKTVFL